MHEEQRSVLAIILTSIKCSRYSVQRKDVTISCSNFMSFNFEALVMHKVNDVLRHLGWRVLQESQVIVDVEYLLQLIEGALFG